MTVFDVVAGVAAGNLLAMSAFWGIRELIKADEGTGPWWAYGATLFPIVVIVAAFLAARA